MKQGLALFLLLSGACGSRGGIPAAGDDAAVEVALRADAALVTDAPAVADSAPATDAAVAADGGNDGNDGGAGIEPSDGGWPRYVAALEERHDRFSNRIAECFNGSAAVLTNRYQPFDADPELAVQLGQLRIDEAAARACLAALGSASCDELARAAVATEMNWAEGPLEPCSRIILRQPAGALCNHDEACESLQCTARQSACGNSGICAPPSPVAGPGESCTDRPCAAGAICDGGSLCRLRSPVGGACQGTDRCAPGLFCAHAPGGAVGTCRAVVRGSPCAGSLECPRVFACVRATPGGSGTCQPGKRVGEPCIAEGRTEPGTSRQLSDCGHQLLCLDRGGGFRCHAGSQLGETCGRIPGLDSYSECLEGYCDLPPLMNMGICRPRQTSGPCSRSEACIPPTECRSWENNQLTCRAFPPPRMPGAACNTQNGPTCALVDYCRPHLLPPDPGTPADGVCAQRSKAGQPCVEGWDRCEFSSACVNGVCTKC